MKSDWIWMPHAGHFICADRCQFRMNTYVNGYIISTVGELPKKYPDDGSGFEDIGFERKYETMVFHAIPRNTTDMDWQCCPYEAATSGGDLDMAPYNTATDAYKGHIKMCEKYDNKKDEI